MIIRRNGKAVKVTRVKRVVVLPHTVQRAQLEVPFGKSARVNGELLVTGGTPLGGQQVSIVAAPDNGLGQFVPVTTVTTSSTGTWTATLPAGPSRLIEAVYAGSSTAEPVTSGQVRLSVPARISLSVSPRVLPWRGRLTIRGHLDGGYVPSKGVPLELYIRYPNGPSRGAAAQGLRTDPQGRFSLTWSFHSGHGVATYPVRIATLSNESDYPYVASSTPWMPVTFGKPTPHQPKKRGRRHRTAHGRHR